MSEEITMSEIEIFNSLLHTDLENIEDLPDFETFVPGEYILCCDKMELDIQPEKDIAKIKAIFSNKGNMNPDDYPEGTELPKEGSKLSQQWGKEFGIKIFKKTFLAAMETLGCANVAQFIEQAEGMEFAAYVGNRKDTQGKTDEAGNPVLYNDIRTAIIA